MILGTTFDLQLDQLYDMNINPRQAGIDNDHVRALMGAALEEIPPIVIYLYKGKYILIDGYHRVKAFKLRNIGTIRAQEVQLPQGFSDTADALKALAYEANLRHGRPLTPSERREYAQLLYRQDPTQSWIALAKRLGVSDKTAKSYIEQEQKIESGDRYEREQPDYAKRLVSTLGKFYENEYALIGFKNGKTSEDKRANLIVDIVKENATKDTIAQFQSLARTLGLVATKLGGAS